MANKLIVSLSPHVHSGDSIQKNMYGVLIALIPALLVSFYMFGPVSYTHLTLPTT